MIAANAGGAWSPIGDVTTTMLWIGGQVTTFGIMKSMFLPSIVCILVPLLILSVQLRGRQVVSPDAGGESRAFEVSVAHRNIMFAAGIAGLLFVPVFKTLTHLPPDRRSFVGYCRGGALLGIALPSQHRRRRRLPSLLLLLLLPLLLPLLPAQPHPTPPTLQWLSP